MLLGSRYWCNLLLSCVQYGYFDRLLKKEVIVTGPVTATSVNRQDDNELFDLCNSVVPSGDNSSTSCRNFADSGCLMEGEDCDEVVEQFYRSYLFQPLDGGASPDMDSQELADIDLLNYPDYPNRYFKVLI